MTTESARELFPGWAEAEWKEIMEDKDQVKIWEPRRSTKGKAAPKEEKKAKKLKRPDWDGIWFTIRFRLRRLKLKNPRAVGAIQLAVWTLITCGATYFIARHNTTETVTARVTSELRAGFNQYLADLEYERSAEQFLTGDESLQTAMDAEADSLARLLYGYRNNSLRDRKTLIWCVLARVDSKAYPGSVAGVVDQAKQWMFYSIDNPIREDDRQLALEQLQLWHEGKYPAGFSDDYVYAEWTASDIALRNTWEKDSSTSWWRFPE